MAERSVTIRLRGDIADFSAKMKQAGVDAEIVGKKGAESSQKYQKSLQDVGNTAGKIGLVAAAGVTAVVATAANFEQAMSHVAATGDDARGSLDALRDAAIDAGAETAFSASEAAAGIENLAKAGVSAQDILGGGLDGALSLAAAGTIEVADAAEVAATAMTQFKLAGTDVPHIADLLAAAAGKAQGGVSDMAFALKQSGLVASQMGLSIEDTTGTLGAFASAGLLGSDAGTSLRTMLLRLANPSGEAAQAMKELGIQAYDSAGNFVGITALSGQLSTAFEGQTQATRDAALATIFGSDAIRAANVLYTEGAAGVGDWIEKVDDSGYAAATAATKMDNLKGDLEQFMGSLETALIGAGDGSQTALRGMVQGATDTVNAISQIPGPVLDVATALLAVVAITGGSVFLGARVIGAVQSFRASIDTITVSARQATVAIGGMSKSGAGLRGAAGIAGVGLAMTDLASGSSAASQAVNTLGTTASGALLGFSAGGPIGAAIGGGIGLITSLGSAFVKSGADTAEAAQNIDTYKQSLDAVTGAITESTSALVARKLEEEGMLQVLEQSGLSTDKAVEAIVKGGAALDTFKDGLREQKEALEATYGALDGYTYRNGQGVEMIVREAEEKRAWLDINQKHIDGINSLLGFVGGESDAIGKSVEAKSREIRATDGVLDAKNRDAFATDKLRGATDEAVGATDDLTGALEELEAALDRRQGKRNFEQSIDDFADAMKKRKELIADLAEAESELGSADTKSERNAALDRIESIKEELADYALTLKTGEQAGRDWQERLEAIASEGLETASTLEGVGQREYLKRVRREFREAAEDIGLSRPAIRKLMDDLQLLDGVVVTPKVIIDVTSRLVAANAAAHNEGRNDVDRDGRPDFWTGGYTGNGGKYEPAGTVHGGEFVFDKETTAANRGLFEAIHRGQSFSARSAPVAVGGGVGGGWDMERLVATVAKHTRPLSGDVHISGDPTVYRREMQSRKQRAKMDGVRS